MNEIICPNCNKAFKIDEAGFADIVKQVRDSEFNEELQNRLELAENEKLNAVELAEEKIKNSFTEIISKKDAELIELRANTKSELIEKLAEKDSLISEMKSKIENSETEKKLAVTEAVKSIEKERDVLANDIQIKELEKENLKSTLEQKYSSELQGKDAIIRLKDEEIERVKDMKLKLSTKMLGETLEQHCEIEFNKLRATAFQNAYFEKDNDSKGGTKGDFIYRESDINGNEIISIMFEMKNENDETATKKRNEDFFAKLDKDRNDKKCEYAINCN